jgi:hypothetical protein
MTSRIDRLSIEQGAVLRISGRMTGEDLDVLRIALEEGRVVALDFTGNHVFRKAVANWLQRRQ